MSEEKTPVGIKKRGKSMCKTILRYKYCVCCRFAVEQTVELERAFFNLAVDTMAVVISLASRDAAMTSFAEMFNQQYENGEFLTGKEDEALTEAAGLMAITLSYALGMTMVIIYLMLITGPSAKKEKQKAEEAAKAL